MKSAILIIMLIVLASSVSAATHYLVVDDNGPASDVLKMNGLSSFLIQEGQKSESYLSSEMPKASNDVITVFIYFGESVINYPSNYKNLAIKISDYLKKNYNINADLNLIDKEETVSLIKQIPEEKLPEAAKGILYFNNLINTPLIIYGVNDLDASKKLNYLNQKKKKFDEVSSTELLNSDLLIIGGPCANKYWELFSNETCESWSYPEKKVVIKVKKNGAKNVIMIAGTTKEDTQNTVDSFTKGLLDDKLKGKKEVIISL